MQDPDNQSPDYWLAHSDIVFTVADVTKALDQIAQELHDKLAGQSILLLCVMRGGLYLAGQLMQRLQLPARLDYLQANRYHGTSGSEIVWAKEPEFDMTAQTVVVLDDILDEGITLAEVVQYCQKAGATQVLTAVLADKDNGCVKPLQADVVGLTVPNRYVFGCGMDVYGWWRNLPEIRALK
ncbi:hypoxanthine-guanine phosphoribosyltransferase [Methylophilus sp. Leaf414]|uniref:hypoxanthine-guanine phosphoribosyltransferase n=1 Tax=Methylophilus sp. Leaf414 TaxID=1736371 RepID=UPI0006F6AE22|nr:hypoxanthine-guanine phosphoribosyltransferase [Methylophilus sp. Leaf414]KQT37659.1 hypoxanthine phosphoribosyltransferase [Methylophilus sp. Leaf414]